MHDAAGTTSRPGSLVRHSIPNLVTSSPFLGAVLRATPQTSPGEVVQDGGIKKAGQLRASSASLDDVPYRCVLSKLLMSRTGPEPVRAVMQLEMHHHVSQDARLANHWKLMRWLVLFP